MPSDGARHTIAYAYDGQGGYDSAFDAATFHDVGPSEAQVFWVGYNGDCGGSTSWNDLTLYHVEVLPLAGTWTSPVIDTASLLPTTLPALVVVGELLGSVAWNASVPAGARVDVALRTSQDAVSWSAWRPQANGQLQPLALQGPDSQIARYAQVRVDLAATDPLAAPPVLHALSVRFVPDLRAP